MVPLDRMSFLGTGLVRPECVVTHISGMTFAADWAGAGGIAAISTDGRVTRIAARRGVKDPLRPNGIALEPGGSFLLAHLGTETGGLFRLRPDGTVEPVLLSLHGAPLPPSNFPLIDRQGRIWLTVSTRVSPRALDYRPSAASGFIVLIDGVGARIVADDLGYANECALSADEKTLFVNETFGRRLTRFSVAGDGSLLDRTVVTEFGAGTFPDGLARDGEDHLWVTSIVSNRVIRVGRTGHQTIVIEDSDSAHLAEVETAFGENRMERSHLDSSPSKTLRNTSSLAFGGPCLRRAFLGSLLDDRIANFDAPVAGVPHTAYTADLGPLSSLQVRA
jgi:hypothetical protein